MKWSELIEQNRDKITELIEKAYREAADGNPDLRHMVVINENGGVDYRVDFQNSTPGDVWNGKATIVYSVCGWKVDPDYLGWFKPDGWMADRAGELLAKYNSEYETNYKDITEANQGDLIHVLHEYFPAWVDEICKEEADFEIEQFDADATLDRILMDYRMGEEVAQEQGW
jgi:hypothetical protein